MARERAGAAAYQDAAGGAFLDEETLGRLKSSVDRRQFATAWLSTLAKQSSGIRQGMVVLSTAGQAKFEPVAIWPEGAKPEKPLMMSVEVAVKSGRAVIQTINEEGTEGVVIAVPMSVGGQLRGAVAVVIPPTGQDGIQLMLDHLQWGTGWLETLIRRSRVTDNEGLVTVVDLLATSLHHARFQEAATAVATELAGGLNCERVAIGFMKGKHIRVRALSHSASFQRKANLLRAMEAAMDEALDQQATIVTPQPEDAPDRVIRAHEALMQEHGIGAVCTVPLAEGRKLIGAILLERPADQPFKRSDVQLCEHAAALLGPTLDTKRREDRWLPAKAWEAAGNVVRKLFGPRHAALKLGAVLFAAFVLFCIFAKGTYRVSADALLEGTVQRAISSPVQGYLSESGIRAGDIVREGAIVATLDMTDLRLEKLKWESARAKQEREYSEAQARKERSRSRILAAQLQQAEAQLELIDQQLDRMRIRAPFDGLVVSGDLSQALGAPVERGDILFEIAPLDDFRVMLKMDERDVSEIQPGQTGTLALSAMPSERLPIEVVRLTPISTAEDGLNYFTVETVLTDTNGHALRPGMEGVGKIEIDERRLIWIWTRKIVLWFRLFVWSWTP